MLVVCAAGCRSSSDVVFVIDSSPAVDYPNFQHMKSFLADLVLDLAVDSGQIRVGLVTYASVVEERFNLVRYSRRDDVSLAISDMTKSTTAGPRTDTASAIAYVRQHVCIEHSLLIFSFKFVKCGQWPVALSRLGWGMKLCENNLWVIHKFFTKYN